MATIVAITNQKGGACKTTTAAAMASVLSQKGKRVLAVDLDAQGNLSEAFGMFVEDGMATVFDCLAGDVDVRDAIRTRTAEDGSKLDLLSSDLNLSAVEMRLSGTPNPDNRLKLILGPVIDDYDWVILDCPPSLNLCVRMALTAADYAIVPVKPARWHVRGLTYLDEVVKMVRKYSNPRLKVLGVLVVLYHPNFSISKSYIDVMTMAAQQMDAVCFESKIREATEAEWAAHSGVPITEYNPSSNPACDYRAFVDEVVARVEEGR